jgi:hypothetical protein
MTDDLTLIRIQVLESFSILQDRLADLQQALLQDHRLMGWAQEADSNLSGYQLRTFAFEQIAQLEYLPKQAPREILICVGFLGASQTTLEVLATLNQAKRQFKQAMLALKAAKVPLHDPYLTETMENILGQRPEQTRVLLKKMGLARLHLKQCYRIVPILDKAPSKISWTWANTRAIKRISKEEALKLLQKKGADLGIMRQMEKAMALPAGEKLAIVQELAPHLRTNLVFGDKTSGIERRMIKGSLPVFFPANDTTSPPTFKPPKTKQVKNVHRQSRTDQKLDPEPFLPAIHAHRYVIG